MSRIYKLYLNDILKATAKIERFANGLTADTFKADEMRVDSILMNLMIVGEAVKNLPDDMKVANPEIRWRDIGRFRDRVVHHYFSLDLDVVWEIVQLHLPVLRTYVEKLLAELGEEDNDQEQS